MLSVAGSYTLTKQGAAFAAIGFEDGVEKKLKEMKDYVSSYAKTMTQIEIHTLSEQFGDKFLNDTTALDLVNAGNHVGFCYMVYQLGWKVTKEFVDLYYQHFMESVGKIYTHYHSNMTPEVYVVQHYKENLKMLIIMDAHVKRLNMVQTPETTEVILPVFKETDGDEFYSEFIDFIEKTAANLSEKDIVSLIENYGAMIPLALIAYELAKFGNIAAYTVLLRYGWCPNSQFIRGVVHYIHITAFNHHVHDNHTVSSLSHNLPILSHLLSFD